MGLKQATAESVSDKVSTIASLKAGTSVPGSPTTAATGRATPWAGARSKLSGWARDSYDVVTDDPETVAFAQKVDELLAVQMDVVYQQSLKSRKEITPRQCL